MNTQLEGKVVFITGASGGIGRALSEAFAAEGCRLVLQGWHRFVELEKWVVLQDWRDRALVVQCDVTNPKDLEAAFGRGVGNWGRVDVCVANAGMWPPTDEMLWELSEERVREVVEVNLMGALWSARAFLSTLNRTGPGEHGASLVFTGSTAARFGERGHADYASSKAALSGLVATLKNEIVRIDFGGRVNMVEPGWTMTDMARPALDDPQAVRRAAQTMSLQRLADPSDVARAAVFLASPAAAHVTGQTLSVSGGMEGRVLWDAEELDAELIRRRTRPG